MNANQMFYTTIAAIALGIFFNWRAAERLDKKGDKLADKLDRVEQKLELKIETLRTETRTAIDSLRSEMVGLHERLTRAEERKAS